jgi:hypothetical protein
VHPLSSFPAMPQQPTCTALASCQSQCLELPVGLGHCPVSMHPQWDMGNTVSSN